MQPGDRAFVYHTGKQRALVGVATVLSQPYPDPAAGDGRYVAVDIAAAGRLARPVTLAEVKADPAFSDWELVRLPRLSVMPVPADLANRLLTLSGTASPGLA